LHDGCICLHDGIYGEKWHLRRLRHGCHPSLRWHLWAAMVSTAFATLPPPCAMAWHLGVFTVKCHLAPGWHLWAEMASMALAPRCHPPVRWHLWRDMASMAGTWHLWRPRHLQNALAQAAALTQPKWIG
jgi:hypothetical protein